MRDHYLWDYEILGGTESVFSFQKKGGLHMDRLPIGSRAQTCERPPTYHAASRQTRRWESCDSWKSVFAQVLYEVQIQDASVLGSSEGNMFYIFSDKPKNYTFLSGLSKGSTYFLRCCLNLFSNRPDTAGARIISRIDSESRSILL